MPPLSLLFSSDQETSRQMTQALHELEFVVEPCSEIFAAVEKLTHRSYELIVVDWDDGLEASFLLKTSRELKCNASAFTVAIANKTDDAAAARQLADLALVKPIDAVKAKYGLLTSDAFLCALRTWLPKLQIDSGTCASREVPRQADFRPQDSDPSSAKLESGHRALWPYIKKALPAAARPRRGYHTSLLAVAFGVATFSIGYGVSGGQRIQAASVALYERAVEKTSGWLHAADRDGTPSPPQLAENDGPVAPQTSPRMHIRVTPVPSPVNTPAAPRPQPKSPPAEASQARLEPAAAHPVQIPDSLRDPLPSAGAVRAVATAFPVNFLGGLEPVTIPEDLSEKLLLQKVQPGYPEQALRAGLQGPVVLQAWIARDGTVRDLKLIRGYLVLGQAAFQAVRQWRYKPYLLNGRAVEAQTYITVNFRLP